MSKEKTNLMPLILLFIQYSFNAQHVSAVNTFQYLVSGLVCVGVPFQCGYGGVVTPHRHSHTETERQHTPNQIPPMK